MKVLKLSFIVFCFAGICLFLRYLILPTQINKGEDDKTSTPYKNHETNPPNYVVMDNTNEAHQVVTTMDVANEERQFIIITNEAYGVIITTNVVDGTCQVENLSPDDIPLNIFYFKMRHGLVKEVSTSPEWSAYLASRREKYHFPIGVREWIFELVKLNEHNLIDPTTIPRDEWERFIDIAIQDFNSIGGENFDKEATVIDFTEDFVYVLYLYPPKTEDDLRRPEFRLWFIIDRKKGEVLKVLMGYA